MSAFLKSSDIRIEAETGGQVVFLTQTYILTAPIPEGILHRNLFTNPYALEAGNSRVSDTVTPPVAPPVIQSKEPEKEQPIISKDDTIGWVEF